MKMHVVSGFNQFESLIGSFRQDKSQQILLKTTCRYVSVVKPPKPQHKWLLLVENLLDAASTKKRIMFGHIWAH